MSVSGDFGRMCSYLTQSNWEAVDKAGEYYIAYLDSLNSEELCLHIEKTAKERKEKEIDKMLFDYRHRAGVFSKH